MLLEQIKSFILKHFWVQIHNKKNKMENLIDDDLDLSSCDESDNESDNGSDDRSDDGSNDQFVEDKLEN